jgi:hypothetical protein
VRHIGDALLDANVSFKYYGDGWNLVCVTPKADAPTRAIRFGVSDSGKVDFSMTGP